MDSLAEVDRERDALGVLGGVDPAFVAMTSRVTEIGHALEAIAIESGWRYSRRSAKYA